MKNILFIGIFLLLPLCTVAEEKNKPSFSQRETIDIRVATPGLFAKSNKVMLHLDSLSEKGYAFPLAGAKVISNYGGHNRRNHTGIDIKTCAKDTIRCAFDGVVRLAKVYGGYGKVVVVRHPNGLETVYSHNFSNFVKSGDVVKVGQPIGLTGRTGRASTEHLHFETRVNGQHFNPNLIFDMAKRVLRKGSIQCVKSGSSVIVKAVTPSKKR